MMDGAANDLRENEDVKAFYLSMGGAARMSAMPGRRGSQQSAVSGRHEARSTQHATRSNQMR